MNREHCVAIMRHLPVIQALAEGKSVYFAQFDCEGRFLRWVATDKVNLSGIGTGLYCTKPRYQCMKPGEQPMAIPYPHQQAYINGGKA